MKKDLTEYNFPEDLKEMSLSDLELLSYDVRDFLIEKVSKTGGHLAANLGVVELTIALHKCFESPKDKIIWDVGHQSYVHKILTGRGKDFDSLRQYQGLSGFPKTKESPHDVYETGHASTSVAAAYGFARARDIKGEEHRVVAVIGDGALTSGLAYEGLNNAGASDTDLLLILNDNDMSISRNVGGLSKHLGKLRVSPKYLGFKKQVKKTVSSIPGLGTGIYSGLESIKDSIKFALFEEAGFFESLGLKYIGPVDGHNIEELISALELSKGIEGPKILHVLTKKGKGYRNAETNPDKFHGISPFEPETGKLICPSNKPDYSCVFGETLLSLAGKHKDVVAVYAAMAEGTGLKHFSEKYPERSFDVGIAEGGAVTFAAGLAKAGIKPYVAIYSTFLQRAYDMVMMDVCLQNLPVVFCIDRAGIVGSDGETHHGVFDLSYLSHMPNLTILCPRDGKQLEKMLEYSYELKSPCAIRYPRGEAYFPEINVFSSGNPEAEANFDEIVEKDYKPGLELMKEGRQIGIYSVGPMTQPALNAALTLEEKGISASVIDVGIVKPLEEEKLLESIKYNKIVTIEDNVLRGGFGQSFSDLIMKKGSKNVSVLNLAWPDVFIEQGSQKELYEKYGLDEKGILERILEFV